MNTIQKTTLLALCLAGFIGWTAGCDRVDDKRTLEGQVFIRTMGGDNIKLSLVDVLLFDEETIMKNLESKREAAKPVVAAMKGLPSN